MIRLDKLQRTETESDEARHTTNQTGCKQADARARWSNPLFLMVWKQTHNALCSSTVGNQPVNILKWVSLANVHSSVLIYVILHKSLLIATLYVFYLYYSKSFCIALLIDCTPCSKAFPVTRGESTIAFASKVHFFQTKNLCWLHTCDIGRRPLQPLPILPFSQSLQWHLVITKSALLLALSLSTFYLLILLPRCHLESMLVIEGSNLPVEVFLIHLVNCIVLTGQKGGVPTKERTWQDCNQNSIQSM